MISPLSISDFGVSTIIEGVTIMAVSLCARVVLPMPEESEATTWENAAKRIARRDGRAGARE